jgi:hypothetical protein
MELPYLYLYPFYRKLGGPKSKPEHFEKKKDESLTSGDCPGRSID